jgi:PncC family amidohydrolase
MTQFADLAQRIATILKDRGETVAVSETSAGGLISAALLAIPGASAYFVGGAVLYTHTARESMLEISLDDHPGMRSASEPYARVIASTIRARLGATWGLSETGAAGPTGNSYGDSAGHTCIAVAGPSIEHAETLETGLPDRKTNMDLFGEKALEVFERILLDVG